MNASSISPDTEPSTIEKQEVNANPEYLRCVERVARSTDMRACQDIYASNGIKLIASGSRIDQATWEKLTRHTLSLPLEVVLTAADPVDAMTLVRDTDQIIAAEPGIAALVNRTGDPLAWKALTGNLDLPPPLGFRFKVMREQKRDMYHHALRLAVLAHCIGLRLKWSGPQLAELVLAALCHDLGEMHTDPAIFDSGRAIGVGDLRFIHVHPVTGYVILSQTAHVPRAVALAVLQHHERLDGSGYPHGISGERIQPAARVLAVADLYDAVARGGDIHRLKVILKVEQGQLDQAVVGALKELLPDFPDDLVPADAPYTPAMPLTKRLHRLEQLLGEWEALKPALRTSVALAFVLEQVQQIQIVAWRAGMGPGFLAMFRPYTADQQVVHELHVTLDEIDRLLTALAARIRRRVDAGNPHWAPLMGLCENLTGKEIGQAAHTADGELAAAAMKGPDREKRLPRSVVAACSAA